MKKGLLISGMLVFIACNVLFAGNTANANTLQNPSFGVSNDTLTVSFSVNGNAACKSSIEGALTVNAGVLSATWDAAAKSITVVYLTSKVKKSDLYTFLANAGYDNAELRAKDAVYAALPTSCQYTRTPDNE